MIFFGLLTGDWQFSLLGLFIDFVLFGFIFSILGSIFGSITETSS
jgi:hypothetical protein